MVPTIELQQRTFALRNPKAMYHDRSAKNVTSAPLCENKSNDVGNDVGAGGRTRTGMVLPPGDFESPASTSFTTPAQASPVLWAAISYMMGERDARDFLSPAPSCSFLELDWPVCTCNVVPVGVAKV